MIHKVLLDDPIVALVLVHRHVAQGHQIKVVALTLHQQAPGDGHPLLIIVIVRVISITQIQAAAVFRRRMLDDDPLLQLAKELNLGGLALAMTSGKYYARGSAHLIGENGLGNWQKAGEEQAVATALSRHISEQHL